MSAAETVTQSLMRIGPCLTSDLIKNYVDAGMTEAAARKKVNRALDQYVRLAGLRFTKNARFIYLPAQFGRKQFWRGLEKAFYRAGKSYWCAMVSLRARGGQCDATHFPIICGAPKARKGQLSPARILERLSEIQLLREIEVDGAKVIVFVPGHLASTADNGLQAVRLAENVALHGIKEWARRFGLGSFNQFKMRDEDEVPEVSGIAWDLSAPSYIRPLVKATNGKMKPGFFVCDINLYGVIEPDYIEAFVRKHDMASAPSGVGPIMPMLVGQVFNEDAFSLAKKKGILALTLDNLFGSDVAKALKELIALLSDLGARAAVDPSKIELVINTLTKVEGAATNVRSSLFEVVIGSLVKEVEEGYLKIGEKRQDYQSGRKAEIDVQLDRGKADGVLVIECKSKIPGARVTIEEVQHWYDDRVPLIYSILSNGGDYTDKPFQFEFWTNGPINDDAVDWLKAQPADHDGYKTGWKDGTAVKAYADKAQNSVYRKILKEHYFNHALSKLARTLRSDKKETLESPLSS